MFDARRVAEGTSPSLTTALPSLRASAGYQLAVRAFGSAWFLVLAIVIAVALFSHLKTMTLVEFGPNGWPGLLSRTGVILFYLTLWALILLRPPPAAQTEAIVPSIMALIGTYLPLSFPLLARSHVPGWLHVVSAFLVLLGVSMSVFTVLYLGRSFSLVPQARRLVRTGPYRLIRHPLYVTEEIALLGTVLYYLSPVTVALLVVHCAVQVRRMLYEETLLRQTFPEYRAYAASTARVLPCFW